MEIFGFLEGIPFLFFEVALGFELEVSHLAKQVLKLRSSPSHPPK
jgi:hypothetical protein